MGHFTTFLHAHTHTHTHAHKTLSQARSSTHIHAGLARLFYLPLSRSPPLLAAPVACVFHVFCFVRVFMFCSRPPISLSLNQSLSPPLQRAANRSTTLSIRNQIS